MNRAQFMEQLEKLLSDISEEERQEALDYYESYFDDAGEDQEANVIRELGSSGKVAAIIKADLRESSQNYGEYTENGFQDDRVKEDMQMPEQRGSRAERGYHAERKGSNAGVILVLILLVFISPLIKGAVGGVLGFIVALALLPFLIVFGIGAAVVGLFAAGIAVIGAGIGHAFRQHRIWNPWDRGRTSDPCTCTGRTCISGLGSNESTSGDPAEIYRFLQPACKQRK